MNSFRDNFTKVIDHSKNLDSYDQQSLYTSIVDLRNIHGGMLGGFYNYLNKDLSNDDNKLEMSFLDSMIDTTRKVLQLAESKFNMNDSTVNTLSTQPTIKQSGGSNKIKGGKSYQGYDSKPILMLFHASWCGHCVEFMPTFEKLKREYVDNDKLNIVKISDKNTDLIEKYQIGGFPTIKLYDGKDIHEYQGGRDIVSIRHYVNKVLNMPAIKG
jgi:thiol-disulfide isomerase/thioredoxin